MLLYQTFFFLSGFTSLLYEVALIRLFLPVFGVGILSVTAVLGAFFLGMALGSLAVPRLLLRFRRPALLYPLLELITGLTAVLLPLALTPLVGLYTGIAPPEAGAGSLTAIRFFLATGVMLLPTFAMGGAFPACIEFCRLRSRSDDFLQGARAASLYGANLLGAAVGSAVGGFILLPNLGVSGTFLTISALSLGLAGAVYLLAIRSPVSSVDAPPPQEGLESQRSTLPLLALYLFAGVITVSLELIWYRTLVIHVGASVHSFAILLTTFLLGSAIGSFVIGLALREPRKESQLANIAFTFVLIALTSYSSLQLIVSNTEIFTPTLVGVGWGGKLLREFLYSALFVFPTVMLFGALFSLLAAELRRRGKDDTRTVGDLFAANSIGAVVGAFLCTFIFLEFLGVQRSIELFAAVIMLVGISIGWQQWSSNRTLAAAGILALILSYWVYSPRDLLPQKFAERLGPIGFYKESARDITIAHEMPGTKNRRLAFHDARGTCSTRKAENEVARLLAHTSMAMNPQAKRVLVISYGCGNTTSAFAQYPLERIDIADLSESVREASQFFWTNKGVANDPRARFHAEDGRNFLLRSEPVYDIIELELPNLLLDGVAFLYTKEFYQLARSKLRPGGVISQWMNFVSSGRESSLAMIRTMIEEFPNSALFARRWAWWVNSRKEAELPLFPYVAAKELFQRREVVQDLRSIGITFEGVLGTLLAAGAPLREIVQDAPIITDDRTIVDDLTPKYWHETAVSTTIVPMPRLFPLEHRELYKTQSRQFFFRSLAPDLLDQIPDTAEEFGDDLQANIGSLER